MNKIIYAAGSALILTASAAGADPVSSQATSGFQMIIHQSEGVTTGINMAIGYGTDVRFFSNIEEQLNVDWEDGTSAIRAGTFTPSDGKTVVLGVCSGGECKVSGGLAFTTQVGQGINQ